MEGRRVKPQRSSAASLFILALLASATLVGIFTESRLYAPPRAFDAADAKKVSQAIDRAGGVRIMLGSAAVGGVVGAVALSNVPVVGPFAVPFGAVAGVYCAQMEEDGSSMSKAGDMCRALGHAATAFFQDFQSEYKKQKDTKTK